MLSPDFRRRVVPAADTAQPPLREEQLHNWKLLEQFQRHFAPHLTTPERQRRAQIGKLIATVSTAIICAEPPE